MSRARRVVVAMLVAAGSTVGNLLANPATSGPADEEPRGRRIYVGDVTAGAVAASTPACVTCHGVSGRGSREAGVVASDITWDALTKPYGVSHASGRRHRPYTERLLARAVRTGVDPDGHVLHRVMPRVPMNDTDIAALVAYLKRLGRDDVAGVQDAAIVLGTIVPADGPLASQGRAAAAALAAQFEALNATGGLYGRRIELRVVAVAGDRPAMTASLDAFLREADPFALVGGVLAGHDRELIAAVEAHGVPLVGPLTSFPSLSSAARTTFYLLSGVEQQARALVDFARERSDAEPIRSLAIVHAHDVVPADVVDRLRTYATKTGWRVTMLATAPGASPPDTAAALTSAATTHALLLVDGATMASLATTLDAATLLAPGSLATNALFDVPASAATRLFVAAPSVPADQSSASLAEYRSLVDAHQLTTTDAAWQLAALGSARVMVEGLKLAGRRLDRARLVSALEGLTDFDTGLTPRLRFGRSQRLGAAGAYVMTLDPQRKALTPVTGWRPVD